MIEHLIPVLAGTLAAATPLIFAGLGELVAERTGVINLGVEGMMLIGAVAGFAAAAHSDGGALAGLPAGAVAGMLAAPVFARRSRMRSRIWACTVTSRAVVGSSAMRSSGAPASAMAIITRCFMPPESWKGYSSRRRSGSAMPT